MSLEADTSPTPFLKPLLPPYSSGRSATPDSDHRSLSTDIDVVTPTVTTLDGTKSGDQSPNLSDQSPNSSGSLDPFRFKLAAVDGKSLQLWQFLMDLLSKSSCYSHVIHWTSQFGEFKLADPDAVSKLWGQCKGKLGMNYDKMSRAMRYYYEKGVLKKVPAKRYTYRFTDNVMLQCNNLSSSSYDPMPDQCRRLSPTGSYYPPASNTMMQRSPTAFQRYHPGSAYPMATMAMPVAADASPVMPTYHHHHPQHSPLPIASPNASSYTSPLPPSNLRDEESTALGLERNDSSPSGSEPPSPSSSTSCMDRDSASTPQFPTTVGADSYLSLSQQPHPHQQQAAAHHCRHSAAELSPSLQQQQVPQHHQQQPQRQQQQANMAAMQMMPQPPQMLSASQYVPSGPYLTSPVVTQSHHHQQLAVPVGMAAMDFHQQVSQRIVLQQQPFVPQGRSSQDVGGLAFDPSAMHYPSPVGTPGTPGGSRWHAGPLDISGMAPPSQQATNYVSMPMGHFL